MRGGMTKPVPTTQLEIISHDYGQRLYAKAKRYCKLHGISLATLGRKVTNDNRFFTDLVGKTKRKRTKKEKSSCTVDKYRAVVAWFAENMPDDGEQNDEVTSNLLKTDLNFVNTESEIRASSVNVKQEKRSGV
jgi:hypothetical protein